MLLFIVSTHPPTEASTYVITGKSAYFKILAMYSAVNPGFNAGSTPPRIDPGENQPH